MPADQELITRDNSLPSERQLTKGDYVVAFLFICVVISAMIFTLTGIPYVAIETSVMSFWLVILVPFGIIFSGTIFTYAVSQYTLERQFRDLVLLLMAFNMILNAFLYLLTNASFEFISPFADRDRNRTIVLAFGLMLSPSVLFGSIDKYSKVLTWQKYALFVWGAIVVPAISIWFFLSPEPVFSTTPIGEGISGFSPIAWFFFLLIPCSMIYAIIKYLRAWRVDRNRINMSSAFALCLWFLSVMLFASQSNPFQIMELVWYSVFLSGLLLISLAIFTSSVIEPRKAMIDLVRERTKLLEESREESEFYLNVWGHKIGNLLQSMVLYLEMITTGTPGEANNLADKALEIGRETSQINRQVAALIKLKEQGDSGLTPVNFNEKLLSSLMIIGETFGPNCITQKTLTLSENAHILADEFLDFVFMNILSYICKIDSKQELQISSRMETDSVVFQILFGAPRIPVNIEKSLFSEMQPSRTTLSLDLYTVKILMKRFDGLFEYSWLESSKSNQFTLTFKRVHIIESDSTPKGTITVLEE